MHLGGRACDHRSITPCANDNSNGAQFAESGSANLGLTDAINALEWVQENIKPFGGDPTKVSLVNEAKLKGQVTLLGQSAGAGVISLLYLQYKKELFRSAVRRDVELLAGRNTDGTDSHVWFTSCHQSRPDGRYLARRLGSVLRSARLYRE